MQRNKKSIVYTQDKYIELKLILSGSMLDLSNKTFDSDIINLKILKSVFKKITLRL